MKKRILSLLMAVCMITGDNGITASAIAKKIGIPGSDHIITGDMLNEMSDEELRESVRDVSIFSRVIPEHKMRIVKAFKDNGEIVAMRTGRTGMSRPRRRSSSAAEVTAGTPIPIARIRSVS